MDNKPRSSLKNPNIQNDEKNPNRLSFHPATRDVTNQTVQRDLLSWNVATEDLNFTKQGQSTPVKNQKSMAYTDATATVSNDSIQILEYITSSEEPSCGSDRTKKIVSESENYNPIVKKTFDTYSASMRCAGLEECEISESENITEIRTFWNKMSAENKFVSVFSLVNYFKLRDIDKEYMEEHKVHIGNQFVNRFAYFLKNCKLLKTKELDLEFDVLSPIQELEIEPLNFMYGSFTMKTLTSIFRRFYRVGAQICLRRLIKERFSAICLDSAHSLRKKADEYERAYKEAEELEKVREREIRNGALKTNIATVNPLFIATNGTDQNSGKKWEVVKKGGLKFKSHLIMFF